MLTRAAIVILVILNLGVATWWATRSETPLPPPVERETGVATLELLPAPANAVPATVPQTPELAPASASALAAAPAAAQTTVASSTEPMRAATPEPVPAPAAPPAEPKPVVAVEQCLSLGPFAERAQAEAALARLRDGAARSRLREAAATASGSYRVWIPPAASRELAQATAKRIVEAGFSDYYVIAQGEDANAVALGQYRNRDGAERRLAALKAAGFGAAVISGSAAAASWWIDTALLPGSTAQGIVGSSGAPRSQSLDCARLR